MVYGTLKDFQLVVKDVCDLHWCFLIYIGNLGKFDISRQCSLVLGETMAVVLQDGTDARPGTCFLSKSTRCDFFSLFGQADGYTEMFFGVVMKPCTFRFELAAFDISQTTKLRIDQEYKLIL
jgi:hypothetical protein